MTTRQLCLAVLVTFSSVLPVRAEGRVIIIRSSALPLYETVAKGFKDCSKSQVVGDITLSGDEARDGVALSGVVSKGADVVLSLGSTATRLVRGNVKNIPSVFAVVIDPTSNDIGGPGVPMDLHASTQLEFIQKNFPSLKRIGVLYSPGRNTEIVAELKALKARGTPIVLAEVTSIDKLDAAVQTLASQADCLLMLSDPVIYSPQTAPQLILQTLQRGLPIIAASPAYVKAGALAGLYASPSDSGCVAAGVVEDVLGGKKSSSIAWPSKYVSAVNLIVAKRLNIEVPASLINSAEQVTK